MRDEDKKILDEIGTATGRISNREPEVQRLGSSIGVISAAAAVSLAMMDFRPLEERMMISMRPDDDKTLRYFDFYGGVPAEYQLRHVVHHPPPNPKAERRKVLKVAEMQARRAKRKK